MVIFLEDTKLIGSKTLNIHVYVELEDGNEDEYIRGLGSVVDTCQIANTAFQKSSCLTDSSLYGCFGKSLKEDIDVDDDDSYDYPTIEDMLKRRNDKSMQEWNKRFLTLEELKTVVDYNNKLYNVYIHIFTEQD